MLDFAKRHPMLATLMVLGLVGGAVFGVLLSPGDWSLSRRLVVGAFSGFGTAAIITMSRLMGAALDEDQD